MISYEKVSKDFNEYGWTDITLRTPAVKFEVDNPYVEITVLIMLNPDLPHETSDANVRNAMYGLAEAAIKVAKTRYRLIDAPYLTISGNIHRQQYLGSREELEPIIVTTGTLELRIIERDEI